MPVQKAFCRIAKSTAILGMMLLPACITAADVSFKSIDAEPLDTVTDGAIVLHSGWRFADESVVGDDGAQFSSNNFKPDGWYETTVPTTVLGALVRLGKYPDPYIGTNNEKIPDASDPHSPWRRPWWFRREVDVPASYANKAVWLHIDGINYRAALWVNGVEVANEHQIAGMFRRFNFNIATFVHPGGKNTIALRIFPVDVPGIPGHREPGSDPAFQRNVTEMSALGWDWVPPARDRNMGIWQHIWIEKSGPVTIWDPAAFTDVHLPDGKQASITLRFHVQNSYSKSVSAHIVARIEPEGFTAPTIEVDQRIEIGAQTEREVQFLPSAFSKLNMKDPRLWWPNGYGDHPLYKLTIETTVQGVISHVQVRHFGVRTIGYYFEPAQFAQMLNPVPDGEDPYKYPELKTARVFTVNGQPIRIAGGALVPDFLLTWKAQRYRDEIRLIAEGNQTLARVWGGGIIMPDVFYDEADRRGILVWQDMARSSFGAAWQKKEAEIPTVDKDLYLANMKDTILRLRGRTSLLVWCGTNEAAMQTDIGKALQNELLPQLDGTRPWLPSSSTEPSWAKEPLGTRSFGPYDIQPLKSYFDKYAHADDFLFKNEIGLESSPRYSSVARVLPEAETPVTGSSWITQTMLYHGLPSQHMMPILSERIGVPATLSDYISMSELLSAQAYRAIFEASNKNRDRNPGTMVWMTNAAWLDFNYQLYDWYLHPTAAYYSIKSALAPIHAQYAIDDNSIQVASILADNRPVHLHSVVMSSAGTVEDTRDYDLTAKHDATTSVGLASRVLTDDKFHFFRLELTDATGQNLDRLVTWTQKDEMWNDLLTLPTAQVTAKVLSVKSSSGETEVRLLVHNSSSFPAVHIWLELLNMDTGAPVLPSFWTDNAITMTPGEDRQFSVRVREAVIGPHKLMLQVEGFNVLPAQVAVLPTSPVALLSSHVEQLTYDAVRKELYVVLSQTGAAEQEWIIWPTPVIVDGHISRSIQIALKGNSAAGAKMALGLGPGLHNVLVGDRTLDVRVAE